MGDLSQGISQIDPFNPDKTATEIKASVRQQNTRDQSNQTKLAEALEDMMSMWLSNNQQFMFSDPTRQEYLLKILGEEQYSYFKKTGLDEMEVPEEVEQAIAEQIALANGNLSDLDIEQMREAGKIPKYPVAIKRGKRVEYKQKMEIGNNGGEASLYVTPEDVQGTFDYVADVQSMAVGSDDQMRQGQQKVTETLLNPAVQQLLMQEGVKIKVKDLLVNSFENFGAKDARRFFETIEQSAISNVQGGGQSGGVATPGAVGGLEQPPVANSQGNVGQEMAQSVGLPQQG